MPTLDPKLYKEASGKKFPGKTFPTKIGRYFYLFFSENVVFESSSMKGFGLKWADVRRGSSLSYPELTGKNPGSRPLSTRLDFNLIPFSTATAV